MNMQEHENRSKVEAVNRAPKQGRDRTRKRKKKKEHEREKRKRKRTNSTYENKMNAK